MFFRYILLYCFCTLLVGCGTFFSGRTKDISFESNTPSVEVFIDGYRACTTPCSYPLDRDNRSVKIEFRKAGFESQSLGRVDN